MDYVTALHIPGPHQFPSVAHPEVTAVGAERGKVRLHEARRASCQGLCRPLVVTVREDDLIKVRRGTERP